MATKKERQRRLARQAHERRLERHAQRARRTRLWSVGAVAVVLVAAVAVGIVAALNGFSGTTPTAKAAKAPAASATPAPTPTPSPTNTAAMVNGKCIYTAGGAASRTVSLPPATPDLTAKYTATITTNRGKIVMDLLGSKAPCTVGSFVSLASQKYFNNTPCHRLTTSGIFVLQCGDPTGLGSGGPGYGFNNENLTSLKLVKASAASGGHLAVYPAGNVAMANTGQPGSNGSQFFLVYKATELGPGYTPFGTIVSGLNVVEAVASAGSDNSNGTGDGHPKEKVQIESVSISKA
ncbi:MAG TPA: peptidylprolyl isomerase [Streptosporangiaceae bacterium]|nr:peptidylprolyl isomerase [Streptosporangiaceae bacterium]